MKYLLGLLLAVSISAQAAEWDNTDKALFTGFIVLNTIDAWQSKEIVDHPDKYYETNPILSKHPSMAEIVVFKLAVTGLVYWMVKDSSSWNRKFLLSVSDALVLSAIERNYHLGMRINF